MSKEILNPQVTFYEKNNHTYMKLEFSKIINGKKMYCSIPKIDFESLIVETDTEKLYHGDVFITDFRSSAELKFNICSLEGIWATMSTIT